MSIFIASIICLGLGAIIAFGSILVFTVASVLVKVYKKSFPQKVKTAEELYMEKFEAQLLQAGENCIFLTCPYQVIGKKFRKLRSDLWKKDIVLGHFTEQKLLPHKDFNCYIRVDGAEVFKGMISDCSTAGDYEDFIVQKIRKYFLDKELINIVVSKEN